MMTIFPQSLLFLIPHSIWEYCNINKIKCHTKGMRPLTLSNKLRVEREKILTEFIFDNLGTHKIYFVTHFCREILNCINVIGNIFLVDSFLAGEFLKYGINILRSSSMVVFPRFTRCLFAHYGRNGELFDYFPICLLTMNVYYEKIYMFLWFWFMLLISIAVVKVVYYLLLLKMSTLRKFVIQSQFINGPPCEIELLNRNMQVSFLKTEFFCTFFSFFFFNY